MLILQGSGLLPFILWQVYLLHLIPCSRIRMTFLAVGADLSALGNVALLGSDLRLFSGWWEVWGT